MANYSNISRAAKNLINRSLKPNKVVILLGPRRVGKTTLLKTIVNEAKESVLFLNGEDADTTQMLENRSVANYTRLLGDKRFLVIDEAQAISGIGLKLKLMVDSIDGLKIIASGSSAFDMSNKVGEPLVGRAYTHMMYPLSQLELSTCENAIETHGALEERLVLGSYPELFSINEKQDKEVYLRELVNAYLLKDILSLDGVQRSNKLLSLLKMLAFRVGCEISIESLGRDLGMSKNTVDRYLDLLSKAFVIFRLPGFSRNLDNEITKMSKWYFFDNGVRNALISNFNALTMRDDVGKLWENYLISERIKMLSANERYPNFYFWRTHTRQEIDWIEEENASLSAYEFKWKNSAKVRVPPLWQKNYKDATFDTVSRNNYLDFIL